MPRKEVLVQLSDDLLAHLDERAAADHVSRSALVRAAVEEYLAAEVGAEIDRRIAAGYQRFPQGGLEDAWALANAREAIADEPW